MTSEKKSKNPFINMANEAKKNKLNQMYGTASANIKAPKPTKGFSGAPVRKTGRGG